MPEKIAKLGLILSIQKTEVFLGLRASRVENWFADLFFGFEVTRKGSRNRLGAEYSKDYRGAWCLSIKFWFFYLSLSRYASGKVRMSLPPFWYPKSAGEAAKA